MKASARPLLRAAAGSMRSVQPQPRALLSSTAAQKKLPGGTPGETSDPSEQKTPLGPYYESMLHAPQPIPKVKPEQPPQSSPNAPPKSTSSSKAAAEKKDTAAAKKTTTTEAGGLPTDPDPVPPSPSPPTPLSSSDSSSPSSSDEPNPLQSAFTFGTKLGGPANEAARAERLKALRISKGTWIAGILVPPKPDEPDNCCMSGCVNCVWDRYRDDMEDWAAVSKRAEVALQTQRGQGDVRELGKVSAVKGMPSLRKTGAEDAAAAASSSVTVSMDDDGGGSDTNWVDPLAETKTAGEAKLTKDFWDDELYKNLPVGIREFMKQEKKLKEKHAREGTRGG